MASQILSDVPHIAQTKTWACWYASTQMLIQWRRQKTRTTEKGLLDPSESFPDVARFISNNGITDAQIVGLAERLGLCRVPPMSPTEDAIADWLRQYGPLWVNGDTHIVVIVGIRPGELYIYDPAPVDKGAKEWRSISKWFVPFIDQNTSSGVFLHLPRVPIWAQKQRPGSAPGYTVVGGDTLWKIAERHYGQGSLWKRIYDANKAVIGANPNLIRPGQKLAIPPKR